LTIVFRICRTKIDWGEVIFFFALCRPGETAPLEIELNNIRTDGRKNTGRLLVWNENRILLVNHRGKKEIIGDSKIKKNNRPEIYRRKADSYRINFL